MWGFYQLKLVSGTPGPGFRVRSKHEGKRKRGCPSPLLHVRLARPGPRRPVAVRRARRRGRADRAVPVDPVAFPAAPAGCLAGPVDPAAYLVAPDCLRAVPAAPVPARVAPADVRAALAAPVARVGPVAAVLAVPAVVARVAVVPAVPVAAVPAARVVPAAVAPAARVVPAVPVAAARVVPAAVVPAAQVVPVARRGPTTAVPPLPRPARPGWLRRRGDGPPASPSARCPWPTSSCSKSASRSAWCCSPST